MWRAQRCNKGGHSLTSWVVAHLLLSAAVVAFGVVAEDITQLEVVHAVEIPLWGLIGLSVGLYLAAVARVDF